MPPLNASVVDTLVVSAGRVACAHGLRAATKRLNRMCACRAQAAATARRATRSKVWRGSLPRLVQLAHAHAQLAENGTFVQDRVITNATAPGFSKSPAAIEALAIREAWPAGLHFIAGGAPSASSLAIKVRRALASVLPALTRCPSARRTLRSRSAARSTASCCCSRDRRPATYAALGTAPRGLD